MDGVTVSRNGSPSRAVIQALVACKVLSLILRQCFVIATRGHTARCPAACCYRFVPSAMSCLRYTPRPRLRREALARCCSSHQIRRAWAVIYCTIAHAQCCCSRFSRESSRFHSREIGNEKVRKSRAPGKREPGNEFSNDTM